MPATFPEPSSTSDLIRSTVPSGGTPAGLVNHLANVERRWLRWGFLAEPVLNPWRDQAGAGWLTPDMSADELISLLEQTGRRTRAIVEAHDFTDTAKIGGTFSDESSAPQLQWILLHLLQEYARHAGHLDVSRELIDGTVGELR